MLGTTDNYDKLTLSLLGLRSYTVSRKAFLFPMTYQQIKDIREIYEVMNPHIFKYSTKDRGIDPYFYPWDTIMNYVESLVWQDIRSIGVPFYPQYPVLNYFLDFADPINKIAIEVDGKFHKEQVEKDNERQSEIEQLGWSFKRIEARHCYDDLESFILKRTHKKILIECSYSFIYNYEANDAMYEYNLENYSSLIDEYKSNYPEGIFYELKRKIYG